MQSKHTTDGILSLLLNERKLFIGLSITAVVLAIALQLFLPKEYRVSTLIMPIVSKGDSLKTQLLAANIPFGFGEGIGNDDTLIHKELLQSQGLNERVIRKCNAQSYFVHLKSGEEFQDRHFWKAAERLSNMVVVTITKAKLMKISLESALPTDVAVCLVKSYIPTLSTYLEEKGFDRIRSRRVFLEQQISTKTEELTKITKQLANFSQESKTVSVTPRFLSVLDRYSNYLMQKSKLETELTFFKSFYSSRADIIERIEGEIGRIDKTIDSLPLPENFSNETSSVTVSFQKSPLLSLQYFALRSRQQVADEVLKLIAQQYEVARMDEAENKSRFEVVDDARQPLEPSSPRLSLNFILLFLILNGLGFFWAIYKPALKPTHKSTR